MAAARGGAGIGARRRWAGRFPRPVSAGRVVAMASCDACCARCDSLGLRLGIDLNVRILEKGCVWVFVTS